ncbi:MAG TPA: site-2 protease family protein [Microvirga sp.]|jgi:Zn-dependent protease|nr:site-2 protease family protein [Microvirga sp.]
MPEADAMLPVTDMLLVAAALAVAGYGVYVNRPRQFYRGRLTFDAPLERVWDLIDIRPGKRIWIPAVRSIEWVDEAEGDMAIAYETGDLIRYRIVRSEPLVALEGLNRYLWRGRSAYGDLIVARYRLSEEDGRTVLTSEYAVERGALLNGFWVRLRYPLLNQFFGLIARGELAQHGADSAGPAGAGGRARRSGPTRVQAALAASAIAWLCWEFGISLGLALLAGLVVHEYGHVWAMRRQGHAAARMYLVPFFGGVAVGSRGFGSDGEAATIMLMGPVFGFVPGLACLGLYCLGASAWFAAAALVLLAANLFNLLPVPPLDGGRVTQALIRPLGDRAWFAISGGLVLAGAALALWLDAKVLLVFFVLGALAWSAMPKPSAAAAPLDGQGVLAVAGAYAGLVVLHVAAMAAVLWLEEYRDLADALSAGLLGLG